MNISLIDDWQTLWAKLWSARLALVSGLLGVIETGVDTYVSGKPPVMVILMTVAAFAAFMARFIAQPSVTGNPTTTDKKNG